MASPEADPRLPPSAHADAREHPWLTPLAMLTPLVLVLALAALVFGAIAGGLGWLLGSEAGARWVLARVPGLELQGWQGALLGDRWRFERASLPYDSGRGRVVIERFDASGLAWRWRPSGEAWVGLTLPRVAADRVTITTGPPGPRPIPLPPSITAPLALSVGQLRVATLQLDTLAPVTAIEADGIEFDPSTRGAHRVARLAAVAEGLRAEGGGRIGTMAPLPLDATLALAPVPGGTQPAWGATLRLGGDAQRLTIDGRLDGPPPERRGSEPVAATLTAVLTPLEDWPLERLQLATRALDLAALHARAPRTRLAGEATLVMRSRDEPAALRIDFANTLPGRWDDGRLPLARLTAEMSGSLNAPDRIDIRRAEAVLGDGAGAGGRVAVSGRWQGSVLALEATLRALAPQRLHSSAPVLLLDGPVALELDGLRSPDPAAPRPEDTEPRARLSLDLTGRFGEQALPLRVSLAADGDERRLVVSRLRASAGPAQAEAELTLARTGAAARSPWALSTRGQVSGLEPLAWWSGELDQAWRRGPHRLSGDWSFEGRLPPDAAELPPLELLHRLAGNGTVRVRDSLLAGVPLAGEVTLGYTQAAAPTSAMVDAELRLGGNLLRLQGRADPAGPGQADRWNAELRAERMATLAPLFALHPALADWAPRRGRAELEASATGRWPALQAEVAVRVSQLQLGELALAQGRTQAMLDLRGRRVGADLDLGGIAWGEHRADHLRGRVEGTLAEHRIALAGAAPVQPPKRFLQLAGTPPASGTRARIEARGSWRDAAAGGGRWRADVQSLLVGSWDGSHDDAPPAMRWVEARDLAAALDFGGDFSLARVEAEGGTVRFVDAVSLRWDAVSLDLTRPRTDFALRAQVEPFVLAPFLARLQPGIQWQGDLRVAAELDVRAGERFDAEVRLERRDGDLHIASSEGLLLLGLTDVQLGLIAHDGRWTLTPRFRGRSLGEVDGRLELTTTAAARMPPREARLGGEVQARVADLAIWNAWVPAGWRLGGQIETRVALSGTLGQPGLTGKLSGNRISVRSLLQGVALSDGTLAMTLDGERARIDRFTLRSGEGTLAVSGEGRIGPTPGAELRVVAERFRVIGRVDRQLVASGDARLVLGRERSALEGAFRIDEGLFDASAADAPSLDDDVTVVAAGDDGNGNGAVPEEQRAFQLAVDIDLGERLRVRGRGVDTGLQGELRLSSRQGRLQANGAIRTVAGTYAAYGQKLELERGIVTFTGPLDDPRLDILALRPDIDLRVGVAITGTAQAPRVRLFSEPEMGDTAKLSWLVLGREPDGLGRNDTALLQRAALALLAGEGQAPTDQLLGRLGIDTLSLRQDDTDVRETVVTLGKQLSRRWYLGYERGINAAAGTWQLIYRVAQQFTLRAQSGLENSLDVIWTWRFQETPADAGMRKSTIVP